MFSYHVQQQLKGQHGQDFFFILWLSLVDGLSSELLELEELLSSSELLELEALLSSSGSLIINSLFGNDFSEDIFSFFFLKQT